MTQIHHAPPRQAFTVPQFCADHALSKTLFYEIMKRGKGPRVMRVGRRTLISAEAAADWRRDMETATGARAMSSLEANA